MDTGSVLLQSSCSKHIGVPQQSYLLQIRTTNFLSLFENVPPFSLGNWCPLNVLKTWWMLMPSLNPSASYTGSSWRSPPKWDCWCLRPIPQKTAVCLFFCKYWWTNQLICLKSWTRYHRTGFTFFTQDSAPASNCKETIRDFFQTGNISTVAASLAFHSRSITLKTYD